MTSELFGQSPTEVPAKPPATVGQLATIAGLVALAITLILIVGDLVLDTLFPSRPLMESMHILAEDTEGVTDITFRNNGWLDGGADRINGILILEPGLSAAEEERIFDAVEGFTDWQMFRYPTANFSITVERPGGLGVFTRNSTTN